MLKPEQKEYLSKLSSVKAMGKVSIKPYDPKIRTVAESVTKKIKKELFDVDIRFMGASALGISGQNDIDIYVFPSEKENDRCVRKLNKIFGKQLKNDKNRWKWFEKGFEVSVRLRNSEDPKYKEQIDLFKILKNNPLILKEYEELKSLMNGRTYKDYQIVKYEFYNRVLGLKK